jgi:hypothetical protein
VGSVPAIAWVAETCFALATALRSGADSALLFDALKERDRLDLYSASESRGQAMASIGSGAGAILGGLLAEGDLRLPYVASAAFAVATMMFASRLPESRAHDAAAVGPVQRLRNATRVALGSTQILWVMAIAVFAVVASHVYYYLQQPFLLELGIPVAFFGFLFAATKLVTALVAASAHRLDAQLGERGAVGAMAGVAALGLGAMAFAAGPLGALLLLSRGLLDGLWMPLTNIYLNRRVRSELRATTLSLQNVLSRLALALTLGMLGMTMARFGLAALLGAAALVAALLGLLLVVTCPRGAVAAGRDAEVKHAQ